MVAVWLLIICFLGTVLFTDSVNALFSNSHIGRIDVSKYAEEHRNDDPLVIQNNTNCAKVTYPSVTIYRVPVDPDFVIGATVDVDSYQTLALTTVNHHGRPNHVDFSGPLSGFASFESDGDTSMYVCVHKEPIEGFEEVDIEPHVSVDWLVFSQEFGIAASDGWAHTVITGVAHYIPVESYVAISFDPPYAMFLDMKPHNVSSFSDEGTIWINYHAMKCYDNCLFPLHKMEIGIHISDFDTKDLEFPVDINVFFLELSRSVNDGTPPTPDSYVSELGNIKLELPPENYTTNWTLLCTDYPFTQSYASTPYVFLTVSFRDKTLLGVLEPAITGWVEFVNEVGFRACVGRPRYAAEVPVDASIPYLEYLVISQDGIYINSIYNPLMNNLVITMELEFPAGYDVSAFVETLSDGDYGVTSLMHEMLEGSHYAFLYYYYMAKPLLSQKVYIFNTYTALDSDDAANVETQLGIVFSDGYFPYMADISYDAREIMNAIYPNGEPQSDEEKVKAKYWTNWGCPVGPFDPSATCSVAECDDNSNGGTKTISRVKLTENDSGFCPPLSIEVPCNLPPCSIEARIFVSEPTIHSPSTDTDLTWLWALIGVIFGLGVIGGGGYGIYNMNNLKTISAGLVGSR